MDYGRQRTECDRFRCSVRHILRSSHWFTSSIGCLHSRAFTISSSQTRPVDWDDVLLLGVVRPHRSRDCWSPCLSLWSKLRYSPVLERRMYAPQRSLHGHVNTSEATTIMSSRRVVRGEEKKDQFQINSQEFQLPNTARALPCLIRYEPDVYMITGPRKHVFNVQGWALDTSDRMNEYYSLHQRFCLDLLRCEMHVYTGNSLIANLVSGRLLHYSAF